VKAMSDGCTVLVCSNVGLHCEVVSGFAKGADYHPGMKFSDKPSAEGQHSWNVILIDGVWWPVDCHWAARKRVGKQVGTQPCVVCNCVD